MKKFLSFFEKNTFLTILILSIPAVWALFIPGYYGASDDIHIAWLNQLDRALKLGQFPPRIAPDLSYQFGYPLFNFVFPLPFYIAEIFHFLGFSLVDSIKLLFFITVPISGYFMYKLLRLYIPWGISVIGGMVYMYAPYRSVDLYVRGAIGEVVSFVFFPLIIYSLINLYREEKSLKWASATGLSASALILTHNIAAYMFLPVVFILAMFLLAISKEKILTFKNYLYAILFTLLSSCYFWYPAITESSLMKYDTVFNFIDHFPTLKQLFLPYWGYGGSVPGPGDGMSFFLGGINIILFLLGMFSLVMLKKQKIGEAQLVFLWSLLVFIAAIVMMNFRSTIIWDNAPLIGYFQFPWRFLMLTTVTAPLFLIGIKYPAKFKYIFWGTLIIFIVPAFFYFRPQDFLGRVDQYFLNRYIPYPVASEEYKLTQEEYLRLPKQTEVRPDKIYPTFYTPVGSLISPAGRNYSDQGLDVFKIETKNDLNHKAYINIEDDLTLNYSKYAYPGWVVKVDGESIPLISGKPYGQIAIPLEGGSHIVEVYFSETPIKLVLDLISLVTILFGIYLILNPKLKILGNLKKIK